jgi:hypothetical protein
MIIDKYVGFIATVINIVGEGPNFGKVQIRITGDQGQAVIQDEDLLWATLMMPITSAAERGIGTSPNWLVPGSTVVGYFLDGVYRSIPMIVGTINQNKKAGAGISPIASGDAIQRNFTDVEDELGVGAARKPNYKDNKVITTASKDAIETLNHIIEIDDTQQSERILVKHKSGSYVEFLPNGTVVVKGTEAFAAVGNDVKLRSLISTLLKSDGDTDITSKKDITIVADGDFSITGKTITIQADSISLEADTINMTGNTVLIGDLSIVGTQVLVTAPTVTVVGAMTLNGRPVLTS